jgi:hypothetical protein
VPPSDPKGPRSQAAAAGARFGIDALLVLAFAAIGRASHESGVPDESGLGLLTTAWPFLVALAAGWLVSMAWRAPSAPLRTGVPVWAVTVAGGMLLRAVSGQGTAVPFIAVATLTLLALLVGWRLVPVDRSDPRRRLAGWSALLGGGVWLAHTALLASRPMGCVGAACFEGGRTHRDTEDIAWILLVSVALLTVAIASDVSRDVGRGRRMRSAALALCGTGAALLVLGLVVNQGRSTGASLWWLHDSDTMGRLLPVLATLVLGIGMFSSGADRWLAALLVLAALLGLAFNAQDERTLLSVPVGLAWTALGVVILSSSRASRATPMRRTGR